MSKELELKIAEELLPLIGYTMTTKDEVLATISPKELISKFAKLIQKESNKKVIDTLVSLQDHGCPTQSFVKYSDIDKIINDLQRDN